MFSVTTTLRKIAFFCVLSIIFLLQSCATHQLQQHKNNNKNQIVAAIDSSKTDHTFFLIGDAGNADEIKSQQTLHLLENKLSRNEV